MPGIPTESIIGYLGVLFILFGIFLLIAGSGIIKVEQVSVSPGVRTLTIGLVILLVGLIMILPEISWFPEPDDIPAFEPEEPGIEQAAVVTEEPTTAPTDTPTPTYTPLPTTTATDDSPPVVPTQPTSTRSVETAINSDTPPVSADVGDQWVRPVDEMTMVFVTAGSFLMGASENDPQANGDEYPQHTVELSSYWIDSTEITNSQFADFLNQNGNLRDDGNTWYEHDGVNAEIELVDGLFRSRFGFEQRPVVLVSWYGAKAYCTWVGGALPTEAQWEYAARSPENSRFPWGNALPGSIFLNFDKNIGHTSDVGSYPDGASWVGALDMSGNVVEWINDWYSATYYENPPLKDPPGPSVGEKRMVRGGGWQDTAKFQRTTWRNFIDEPRFRVEDVGFRCAVNP